MDNDFVKNNKLLFQITFFLENKSTQIFYLKKQKHIENQKIEIVNFYF